MAADWLIFDFETLSDTPWDGTVLSVAYIAGKWEDLTLDTDIDKLVSSGEELFFKVKSQTEYGRKPTQGTIDWWKKQPQEAQDRVFKNPNKIDLSELIPKFNEYCRKKGVNKDTKVMLRGPDFDHTIMASIYKHFDNTLPYNHWNLRDVRTILDVIVGSSYIYKFNDYCSEKYGLIAHDALHDCARDILQVAYSLTVPSKELKEDYAQYGLTLYAKW